ncbi:aryl-alcohol dehydrogenase-like predicted oxidoreductase [Altererythrobacter atlanticus]|uniref:L-glyceraldehyde 3-phosphate reductase n=1 Tax=Croceibacterium atlanticum TaxID=1267766 RepID=A0A0F7KW35_9SPHN|nr:aldo/keto reductase [Croceibacterium atlanticum]AKH43371.1 L-glyceraldehyde 3-phosphate reductase [Croceibacterium atlanticum]MBB5731922.1 aryl-alcohol dehydrogenase-like predicted oxidoreductase [Croceibacterium atlanticum]
MRYNQFGHTGLIVSELCLGAMTFGTNPGRFGQIHGLDQDGATALVKQALDGGINFIDTANVYTTGQSEEFVGGALKALGVRRSEVVIATKGMGSMGDGPNDAGTGRKHLLDQIDASLERLGLDHVDLYQIHGWDPITPMEEALEALNDIVRSGRARYVGVSNWAAWQITKALGISERRGFAKFASLQAYYTVAGRDLERELVPMLLSEGLGLMVWSPLAGGLLSGKYRFTGDGAEGEGRRSGFDFPPVDLQRAGPLVEAMRGMAEKRGVSVAQIALAWLLYQPVVSSVIVGAKRPDQLADNLASVEVELQAAELEELDRLSALPREYPGWMFETQGRYVSGRVSPRRVPG